MPLSVSVCSNVPGYQAPKCFVPNGDPSMFITEFVQYLISISTKSYSLLCDQFAPVFEALKQESVPSRGVTDDQLTQILVDIQEGNIESGKDENSEEESKDDSRGVDLLASDDEEDEEMESENEEDRAFLYDEMQEQEDVSFYRRFHVELDRGIRQERRQQ